MVGYAGSPICIVHADPLLGLLFTGLMLFLMPSQQYQSTEGKSISCWSYAAVQMLLLLLLLLALIAVLRT